MKKSIIPFLLVVALLMSLTACAGSNDPAPTPDSDTKTVYEQLDAMTEEHYRKIKLNIVTTVDGVRLSADYELTENTVTYRVERLNTLPTDGDLTGVSPEYKATVTGSSKIVDGKVSEFDGEGVVLPSYDELKGHFNFSESNLKNVVTQNNSLQADVMSPSAFYGAEVNVQNMQINVAYSETALTGIVITYQTAHAAVTATYVFER